MASSLHRALPVAALLVLAALTVPAPAKAQDLLFTLSGVTFDDGATAVGSFVYDPTTSIFGAFDITTTAGNTGLAGARYSSSSGSAFLAAPDFYAFSDGGFLALVSPSSSTGPGTYALAPGNVVDPNSFGGSGEFVPQARGITAGSLIVTNAAAAPEPGTIALLLTAGVPVVGIVRRRLKNRI